MWTPISIVSLFFLETVSEIISNQNHYCSHSTRQLNLVWRTRVSTLLFFFLRITPTCLLSLLCEVGSWSLDFLTPCNALANPTYLSLSVAMMISGCAPVGNFSFCFHCCYSFYRSKGLAFSLSLPLIPATTLSWWCLTFPIQLFNFSWHSGKMCHLSLRKPCQVDIFIPHLQVWNGNSG